MRAHGWSRDLKLHKNIEKHYPNLDKRFIFVNSGFNLRPTDILCLLATVSLKIR